MVVIRPNICDLLVLLLILVIQHANADDVGGGSVFDIVSGSTAVCNAMTYKVEFTNNWSASNHPNDYPSNAHWSPPVIATHTSGYTMWQAGSKATTGVKNVAELGDPSTLQSELSAAGSAVGQVTVGVGQSNSATQTQTLSITINQGKPLLSAISMVAPSPDWFAGFYNFQPHDGTNWFDSFTVSSQPYDAGTDSGTTYTSANSVTNPAVNIFRITASTSPSSSQVFVKNGNVLPVQYWKFTAQGCSSQNGVASVLTNLYRFFDF